MWVVAVARRSQTHDSAGACGASHYLLASTSLRLLLHVPHEAGAGGESRIARHCRPLYLLLEVRKVLDMPIAGVVLLPGAAATRSAVAACPLALSKYHTAQQQHHHTNFRAAGRGSRSCQTTPPGSVRDAAFCSFFNDLTLPTTHASAISRALASHHPTGKAVRRLTQCTQMSE